MGWAIFCVRLFRPGGGRWHLLFAHRELRGWPCRRRAGRLACAAILVVNNLRDIDTDTRAGKRTLAVKLGRERARRSVHRDGCARLRSSRSRLVPRPVGRGCCCRWPHCRWRLLSIRTVSTRTDGPALNGALAATGRLLAVHSLLAGGWLAAVVSARVKRSVLRLSIPLKQPFVTSTGVVSARELLLLRLEARDGTVGYGEAAPFEPYDGVPLERAEAALTGGGGRRPPQARAAEEIARLDLHARQEERPLAEPRRDALPVNMTLAGGPPEEVAERARAGMGEGYACFKLKVGLPDDAERVAAVRDAVGPWPALRLDANGAWSVDEAVQAIRTLEEHDLELVEQPCRSLRELAEVRQRVSTPIAADESVGSLRWLAPRRGARGLRRREREAGGPLEVSVPAREVSREARANGLDELLSSTLDGPWGIAAALQLAGAEDVTLACGLATLELFDARLAHALDSPRHGTLTVPSGPGLGVTPEPGALEDAVVAELAA